MPGKRSPLFQWHETNRAQFIELGGWDVPDTYTASIENEYMPLRNSCAITDLCHLARYRINGAGRAGFLDTVLTSAYENIPLRTIRNTFMCNDRAGIIDHLQVYKDEQYVLLTGHPSNRTRVLEWLRQQAEEHPEFEVEIVDIGTSQGQFEVRGPSARVTLEAAFAQAIHINEDESTIIQISNARSLITRRKFCGTDGYLVTAGSVYVAGIWDSLIMAGRSTGMKPIGERALDILRIEAGLAGVGTEVTEDVTPIEIGCITSINFKKHFFNGRRALLHSTAAEFERRMVLMKTFSTQVPPVKGSICCAGLPIGSVSSSAFSPAMRCGVGLGFIDAIKSKPGTRLQVRTEKESMEVEVITSPFVYAT